MANNIQLNRRLLLAILPSRPIHTFTTTRFSSTPARYSRKPSVSFGKETDRLIAALPRAESKKKKSAGDVNSAVDPAEQRRIKNAAMESLLKKPPGTPVTQPRRTTQDDQDGRSATQTRSPRRRKKDTGRSAETEDMGDTSATRPLRKELAAINDSDVHVEPVMLEVPESMSPTTSPASKASRVTKATTSPSNSFKRTSSPKTSQSTPSTASPPSKPSPSKPPPSHTPSEPWQVQKSALKSKFPSGWSPRKKLSPDTILGIRDLHSRDPLKFTTETLATQFQVSAEAIRRILRSKWLVNAPPEELEERRERWARRHDRIWDHKAELGQRPKRTRDKEVEGPERFEELVLRKQALGEM